MNLKKLIYDLSRSRCRLFPSIRWRELKINLKGLSPKESAAVSVQNVACGEVEGFSARTRIFTNGDHPENNASEPTDLSDVIVHLMGTGINSSSDTTFERRGR
ncbi:hypothetical protein RDI58_019946 [Solanum bulbocastanum]|uniref:Uncharacterized protein n=1 Tax=Solanum bulbocastanum TaxID=147425 RepID=A0AAN8T5M9_SOLBU